MKKWYSVKAPPMFDSKEICETVAADEKKIVNRIVKKALIELGIGGGSQMAMFTTLKFRVKEVKGADAPTILIGHEVSPSFIKTFARRGKSLIHQVIDEKTKDGENLRVKIIAVTGARVSQNTKSNLRKAIDEETRKAIGEFTFDEAMNEILYGKMASRIFNRLKTITKMKRVEIRKSERGEFFKA